MDGVSSSNIIILMGFHLVIEDIISWFFQCKDLEIFFNIIIVGSWKLFTRVAVKLINFWLEIVFKDDKSWKSGDIQMFNNWFSEVVEVTQLYIKIVTSYLRKK